MLKFWKRKKDISEPIIILLRQLNLTSLWDRNISYYGMHSTYIDYFTYHNKITIQTKWYNSGRIVIIGMNWLTKDGRKSLELALIVLNKNMQIQELINDRYKFARKLGC